MVGFETNLRVVVVGRSPAPLRSRHDLALLEAATSNIQQRMFVSVPMQAMVVVVAIQLGPGSVHLVLSLVVITKTLAMVRLVIRSVCPLVLITWVMQPRVIHNALTKNIRLLLANGSVPRVHILAATNLTRCVQTVPTVCEV